MCSVNNLFRMILGGAFMRPILQEAGMDIISGMIIKCDTEYAASLYAKLFCEKFNCKEIKRLNSIAVVRNYELALYVHRSTDAVYAMNSFLLDRKFFSVVLCGARMEPSMLEGNFILRLSLEGREMIIEDIARELKEYQDFMVKNVMDVREVLINSEIANVTVEIPKQYYSFWKHMIAVGILWKEFFKKRMPEKFFDAYVADCKEIIEKLPDYEGGLDIEEEVRGAVWSYIEKHKEIKIASADSVTLGAQRAMKEDKTILLDDEYYYIPEGLVKKICSSLLETMGVSELKKTLKNEKIIVCNAEGFTVKKKFWNVAGCSGRYRTMRFLKWKLDSPEGFSLEDQYVDIEEKNEVQIKEG